MTEQDRAPDSLPLVIRAPATGNPEDIRVTLGGVRLERVLAINGVRIRSTEVGNTSYFKVTLAFGEGTLDLDIDVDVLRALLAAKEEGTDGS